MDDRATGPGDDREQRGRRDLERLRSVQWLFDQAFTVPGTKWRFGLDALFGLVPGLGDIAGALVRYRSAMDENLLHQGAAIAMELSSLANGFIEEQAPWSLAKDPAAAERLDDVLGALARAVACLCSLLEPFTPVKMAELAPRLGLKAVPLLDEVAKLDLSGHQVQRGSVLFPKPVT